jgi:hypothetical protein
VTFRLGPLADGTVLIAVGGRTPTHSGGGRTAAGNHSAAANLAARTNVGRKRIANLRGIVGGEVDLVLNPVEAKLHRLFGFATVEVVGKNLNRSPGHQSISFPNGDAPRNCAKL